jgi:hypothetical protein
MLGDSGVRHLEIVRLLLAHNANVNLGTDRYAVDNGILADASHTGVVVRGGINDRFNWGGY